MVDCNISPLSEDPVAVFLYAVKSPESKREYPTPRRFKMFLDFLGLKGGLEDQAKDFLNKAKANPEWAQNNLIQFKVLCFRI
jgi:hypothetical protein